MRWSALLVCTSVAACGGRVDPVGDASGEGGTGGTWPTHGSAGAGGSKGGGGPNAGAGSVGLGGSGAAAGGSSPNGGAAGEGVGQAGASGTAAANGWTKGSCVPSGSPPPDQTSSTFAVDSPAKACAAAEIGVAVFPSVDVIRAAVTGVWTLCGGSSAFGSSESGVEFRSDATWFKLYPSPGGTLTRGTGPNDHGAWDISGMGTPGSFGLVAPATTLSYGFNAAMTSYPRKLELENNGVYKGIYGSDAGLSCPPPPIGETPFPFTKAAACALTPQWVTPTSQDEIVGLLVGKWSLCAAPSIFGKSDDIGLEFTADGHYYRLFPAGPGMAIRGVGLGKEGTWSFPGSWPTTQVELVFADGGSIGFFPKLSASPRRFHGDNNGVWIADYAIDP